MTSILEVDYPRRIEKVELSPHKKVRILGRWLSVRRFLNILLSYQIRPVCPATLHTASCLFIVLSKYSPQVLTMSFNYANVKALQEASRRRGAARSPAGSLVSEFVRRSWR